MYVEAVSECLEVAARRWREGDILCLGNGPSLDALEPQFVTIPTMGVNRSCRSFVSPFHTMHDHPKNWKALLESKPRPHDFPTEDGIPNEPERRFHRCGVLFLFDPCNRTVERWICKSLGIEFESHSSGEYAIIASAFLGFRRAWLIGYDSCGKEGHAKCIVAKDDTKEWLNVIDRTAHAQHFEAVKTAIEPLDLEVINCNPGSAIRCWPFANEM
jgi:hypothetical protein